MAMSVKAMVFDGFTLARIGLSDWSTLTASIVAFVTLMSRLLIGRTKRHAPEV